MRGGDGSCKLVLLVGFSVLLFPCSMVVSETDLGDMSILNDFKKGLKNPELLKWPDGGTDPCGQKWPHVFCSGTSVAQIQVQSLGLEGTLPSNFNQLKALSNIGLQNNKFSGALPTFNGLSNLQYAYLGHNQFDTIPADFFKGLVGLTVLSLEYNPLNATTGWSLPSDLQDSALLMNLSLSQTNLIGPIPDFLGTMAGLTALKLSYNKLSGVIPETFKGSNMGIFWLNNQDAPSLSGPIDVVGTMQSLTQLWLHGNKFNGTIPATLGDCASLTDIELNDNELVGPIPTSLEKLLLKTLSVGNNKLTGSIPALRIPSGGFTSNGNSFCQSTIGKACAPEVTALLDFLGSVNYPVNLAGSWAGNNPCDSWLGITCNPNDAVSVINLPKMQLTGTVSPSLANLSSLITIKLNNNNLSGKIPPALTGLTNLRTLDLSDNNLEGPVPKFPEQVKLTTTGNPSIDKSSPITPVSPPVASPPSSKNSPKAPPPNGSSPSPHGSSPRNPPPHGSNPAAPSPVGAPPSKPTSPSPSGENSAGSITKGTNASSPTRANDTEHKSSSVSVATIVGPAVAAVVLLLLVPIAAICLYKKKGHKLFKVQAPSTVVVHPGDSSNNADPMVKIVLANNGGNGGGNSLSDTQSRTSSGPSEIQVMEAGNLVISVQVLRHVTRNFSAENELGRGGFGVVYKGELDDGTTIAVKRMEAAAVSSKGLNEFQAEIAVLSKVRHRHLVGLLGYCIEGNERLLVYEYMPQGALSRHIFDWAKHKLEPISWKRRLAIALDVARGMEYLHGLAHRSFIHRDLKPSNILLGDDFRAKVSDFGLVKLAPEGKYSVETRLAGTFGYLAPEYAVTGRITTKADVFSFGVVLMELITGRRALDENEPEESMHLVSWFRRMNSDKESFLKAIDPILEVTDEAFESICIVAELAGHCTAREPYQRPDMGHAVNVLAPLVEKWKPTDMDSDEYEGIDLDMTLPQALKKWQAFEVTSTGGLDDSKGSLPTRPTGFADSFTSADGR